ncbi:MAG: hypothetical protein R2827_05805 [Bdellovibrionales bacterium]
MSNSPMDSKFKKFLIASLAGHIAVVIALNISPFWYSDDDLIIKNAIQVDVVGLPEKKKPKLPPKKADPKPKAVAPPKKEEPPKKVVDKKLKDAQESAFEKLKNWN